MTNTLEPIKLMNKGVDWTRCPGCGWLIYHKRLARNLHVCPECEHHLRLSARLRVELLVDPASFDEVFLPPSTPDPLGFADVQDYPNRLADAAVRSMESEAVVLGSATFGGRPAFLAVMDFAFMGGSMGMEVGRRVSEAAELARQQQIPLIVVCASGGARMQEGVFSLFQVARTSQAFARLRESGVLSVCVLTDPTYGGVSASFANLGSIVVAERGAHVGFAGPRVIQQTIRSDLAELGDNFQTAEYLSEHGLVDRVENRAELRPLLIQLVALHRTPLPSAAGLHLVENPNAATSLGSVLAPAGTAPRWTDPAEPAVAQPGPAVVTRDSWDIVQMARSVDRPTTLDYIHQIFEDFVELHGDRVHSDDPAIVGGGASIDGRSVGVIGHQKGHTVKEMVSRRFGMAHPEGYRKAMRLMDHAETFGMPVVTFVDTPGAHPGPDAEERGQSIAIADTIMRSARLRVPVVAVVTGEGGSGGALALCTSDRLLVLENAFLSVISPEGCAAILWRTAASAPAAARALRLGAAHLIETGIANCVVPEPLGGAQADPVSCAQRIRVELVRELRQTCAVPMSVLLALRELRFSHLGYPVSTPAAAGSDRLAGGGQ